MPNPVPHALVDFAVYLDSTELMGIVDATLPEFGYVTEELSGAGIAGVAEVPIGGQLRSMTLTLNWRSTTRDAVKLLAPKMHTLDLRAARQDVNAGSGVLERRPIRVATQVMPKQVGLGRLTTGRQEAPSEFEVITVQVWVDGTLVIDIDKMNYKCVINGVDYMADVRTALGK